MNKDVIYIEPEDDITDILANIKSTKNKIVALVPPKKAGVLRSAVNFKLIAKAAKQADKTVVLITSDESLLKLANNVKMPTAKTLQSKPKLPTDIDADEFGTEGEDDDDITDDDEVEAEEDDDVIEEKPKKIDVKKLDDDKKDDAKKVAAAATVGKKKAADMEIDDDDFIDDDDEEDKKSDKKKKAHKSIPNFSKVRLPIILGVIALLIIFGFGFWALNIAPAAKIIVKIKTTPQNLSENVSFVTDESKAKPEEGIFFIEEKTIKKTAESEFAATGEVDKGAKATGSITITRPADSTVGGRNDLAFSIPEGAIFTCNGVSFKTTVGGSANATEEDLKRSGGTIFDPVWVLKREISSGQISVVAAENGDKYNIAANCSGWTSSLTTDKKYTVSNSAMTGGTSKKVKVVSQKDVETAEAGLESEGESEAREELMRQFSNKYLLIEKSFSATSGKLSSSPAINEEVKDGVKPKVIKEIKYTIYAVERDALNKFIKSKASVGDDTQTIYSTGIGDEQSDDDKGRIESFKKEKDKITGILKTVIKTGPEVTEQMLADKALGKKIGEVQSLVKSIKGVNEVKVDTSYFWVTSVPSDPNKVSYDITVE
ncbi:MAG: hypothetical protein K6F57_04755 [Candidatus Saccharibacteria bacterium]|nr:hypothetical protein [Candidatus Saccharibacteria bacterium]